MGDFVLSARNILHRLGVRDSKLSDIEAYLQDEYDISGTVTYVPTRVGYRYELQLDEPIDGDRLRSVVDSTDEIVTARAIDAAADETPASEVQVMDYQELDNGGSAASAKASFRDGQQTVQFELYQENGEFQPTSSTDENVLEVLQLYFDSR